ncbi:hypothetical protein [Amycolatopsis vastitatis]|uniref:hypothetical protein n=1 Tax=Amycolatopsis vastitatis TaxID=1905142 RepID=UPI0011780C8A|nr:hypothetical protein [Amycolatopsis vastitatis]
MANAPVKELGAGSGWALRPHGWVAAADGVPVGDWRAYITGRREAAGVPYAFQIDLVHRVTAVINQKSPPDETVFAHRIAELSTRTPGTG